jgi:hypothetical protein
MSSSIGTVESYVVTASGENCEVHCNAAKGGVIMLTVDGGWLVQ